LSNFIWRYSIDKKGIFLVKWFPQTKQPQRSIPMNLFTTLLIRNLLNNEHNLPEFEIVTSRPRNSSLQNCQKKSFLYHNLNATMRNSWTESPRDSGRLQTSGSVTSAQEQTSLKNRTTLTAFCSKQIRQKSKKQESGIYTKFLTLSLLASVLSDSSISSWNFLCHVQLLYWPAPNKWLLYRQYLPQASVETQAHLRAFCFYSLNT
jgi:hypothetical protein